MKRANRYAVAGLLLAVQAFFLADFQVARYSSVNQVFSLLDVAAGTAGAVALLLLNERTPLAWRAMMVFYTAEPFAKLGIPSYRAAYVDLAHAVLALPGIVAVGTAMFSIVELVIVLGIGWTIDGKLHRPGAIPAR